MVKILIHRSLSAEKKQKLLLIQELQRETPRKQLETLDVSMNFSQLIIFLNLPVHFKHSYDEPLS